jgi:hypothetical protein
VAAPHQLTQSSSTSSGSQLQPKPWPPATPMPHPPKPPQQHHLRSCVTPTLYYISNTYLAPTELAYHLLLSLPTILHYWIQPHCAYSLLDPALLYLLPTGPSAYYAYAPPRSGLYAFAPTELVFVHAPTAACLRRPGFCWSCPWRLCSCGLGLEPVTCKCQDIIHRSQHQTQHYKHHPHSPTIAVIYYLNPNLSLVRTYTLSTAIHML